MHMNFNTKKTMNFESNKINLTSTIAEAKLKLKSSTINLLVISDSTDNLFGVVTEGDIRRAENSGIDLSQEIKKIANTHPLKFTNYDNESEVLAKMRLMCINVVPIVNDSNQVTGLFIDDKIDYPVVNCPVVIMAGGRGVRVNSITNNIPKPLLKIGSETMIEILIKKLVTQGFKNIFISVNFMKSKIKDLLKNGQEFGASIQYLEETQPLGTAGSLYLLKNIDFQSCLVIHADVFGDINFRNILENHQNGGNSMTIATTEKVTKLDFGVVIQYKNQQMEIVEKPEYKFDVFAGISIFEKHVLSCIEDNTFLNITDLFNQVSFANQLVGFVKLKNYWQDLGSVNSINETRKYLLGNDDV